MPVAAAAHRTWPAIALLLAVVAALIVAPAPARAEVAPPAGTPGTVTAEPLPTVQVDGVVWSQVVVGNKVFVGGDFDTARPAGAAPGTQTVRRTNLLAYDIRTGALDPGFDPSVNGQVLTLTRSPDGKRVYAGGEFTSVDGAARWRIAAFDSSTGSLLGFAPNAGTTVRAIAATDSAVYFGGDFRTLNSVSRPYAGAVSAYGGDLMNWRPAPDGPVTAMTLNPGGSLVVIGGRFGTVGGTAASGIAAVGATDGARRAWGTSNLLSAANDGTAITSLISDGSAVYASVYNWKGGGNLEGAFRANGANGNLEWISDCHGDHYSLFPNAGALYVSSHSYYCGNIGDGFLESSPAIRYHATALTTAATTTNRHNPSYGQTNFTGKPSPSLLHWYPTWERGTFTGQDQATWHVTGNSDYVVYGGEFLAVNGRPQQGLVRFARVGLAPRTAAPAGGDGLTPSAVSTKAGTVELGWQAATDRDHRTLTYAIQRNGATIGTTTAQSTPWNRPTLTWRDSGLTAGSSIRYRIVATDAAGNSVASGETAVTVASSSRAYPRAVLQSDPVHWFRMNEPTGGALVDGRGSADATGLAGAARGVAGATSDGDRATTLPGTADGNAATQLSQRGPQRFTVEAWLKTSAGGRVIGFGDERTGQSTGARSDRHLYVDAGGRIRFGVDAGTGAALVPATVESAPGMNDGRWHHAVGTLGTDGLRLYVDGRLVASRADVTRARDVTGYWRIGGDRLSSWPARPASDNFRGSVDEVAVYHRALTAREVATHYQAATGTQPAAAALTPLKPARLIDTRSTAMLPAGGVLQVPVAGAGGVPSSARAASLNVTVTGSKAPGYLTVYPCGTPAPNSSNLNFVTAQTIPNAVLSGIGSNGRVCIRSTAPAHVVVDVNGWFAADSGFGALSPVRLADTRVKGGAIAAGGTLRVKVAGVGGVPANATAASLNVTVTGPAGGGHLTVYPCGVGLPAASNLNFSSGQTIPNAVVSGIGAGGEVCFTPSARTHVVVDANGFFSPSAGFAPITPARAIDTRTTGAPLVPGTELRVKVGGAAVPSTAAAVSLNVAVTRPTAGGWLVIYPCGSAPGASSNLNFSAGQTIANAVLTGTGPGGTVCIRGIASAHVVVDVNGYFPG